MECQNGSIHSHSMVSVMFLLLNLLFCFCMHLFRLGHLTVCLIDMLCGIIALKLIWLYNGWHKYVPLPLYQIGTSRKYTDDSCHISLTLFSSFLLSLCLSLSLSLAFVKDSEPGNLGLPYQLGILHILPFYFSYLCLLSLAFVKDSEPGNAGLPYQLGILDILSFYFSNLGLLSLASVKDSDTGNAGLPYQLGILHILSFYFSYHFLTLFHSGKGPCIRHTKVQWEVGIRYINPIQPYSFSRQLYLSYQDMLCTVMQLGFVRVVNWFPCWGALWNKGWNINATLLFFYSTAPRTSCLGSPVACHQKSGTEDARYQKSGTEVARYHRPFEARSANSTRRETFRQLAAGSL